MSIRALRTLVVIARTGSFARAGEVVGLTQSAVSLQVKSLEEEFGARLFDRSRRRPTLTEAGQVVLEKAQEILAIYDQIEAAIGDEQSLTGRLKLGAIQTALSGILPEALAGLYQQHDRVRVHVVAGMSAELALQVAAGDLDAAITTEPVRPHPPNLSWRILYDERFWVVAPHGSAGSNLRSLLEQHPFIRFDSRAWAGRMIETELRRQKLNVREEMELDSQDAILRMVEKGLGVTVLPLGTALEDQLDLPRLPFGTPQLLRRVVMLEREDRRGGRIADALAAQIRSRSGQPGAADPD